MRNKLKIFLIFTGCLLFRLIPLRAPNVEPIMASLLPVSRKFSAFFAFLFGFLSIFIYDLLTHFGSWTWIAGIAYGLIGVAAYLYFQKYQFSALNSVIFAFIATIAYDLVTGVFFAPMFHQTILTALAMQIPFTLLHLAGNISFALTLSPVLGRWLYKEATFQKANSLIDLKKA